MAKTVELLKKQNFAVIFIQNPPYNTLSASVFEDLSAVLTELKNDAAIKAVVITGKGVFSAGADVKEIWQIASGNDKSKARDLLSRANGLVNLIENLGKPVIAAIDGYCLGGGNEVAMACSARLATNEAHFGQPEINLGIMPGMGGTQRLPRLVGLKAAMPLLLMGNIISAQDAKNIGLVDAVVGKEELILKTRELIQQILAAPVERKPAQFCGEELAQFLASDNFKRLAVSKSAEAVRAILEAIEKGMPMPLEEALRLEQELFVDLAMTEPAKAGIAKFLKIEVKKEEPVRQETNNASGETTDVNGELKLVRQMIKEFARDEVQPKIAQMEQEEQIPPELVHKMAELGFYGMCFPEKYGGTGLGKRGYCVLMEELSRIHASTATLVGAHVGLACGATYIGGNEEQKQKYLRAGIEGKMIGAFALTEAGAGSDSANIQTMAVQQGNKWVLNGTKQFITNGDIADFVVVIAQTDRLLGVKGLTAFIVETRWPGFRVSKVEKKIGIKASRTCELVLENVEVPEENRLGGIGQGFKIFMQTLNGGRLSLAAGCLGAAKEAFEQAYQHASQRRQFDKLIIEQEAIQFYFARMKAKIYLMESGIWRAATKVDAGHDIREEAAMLKLTCSELSFEVIDTALQIFGGYGYMEEYPLARIWRDSRINKIFEGTSEIQQLMIFKEIFKSEGKLPVYPEDESR